MTTIVQRAQAHQINEVAALFDLYRQFYEQPADFDLALAFITERFNRKDSVLLIAKDAQGALLGFCQLYPSLCSVAAAPIYVLYDVFVLPSARGHGAGRQLMQAAQAQAVADGKCRMDLTTAKTNAIAQSLYESLGWQRDEVFYSYNLTVLAL